MSDEDIQRSLGADLESGRVALLTGAGFSVEAKDAEGRSIPTGDELASDLWQLCFPSEERDRSELEDLFQHALAESPRELEALLRRRLCVDKTRVPEMYRVWFSLPWRRIYTLNVDDLESAVADRFVLPRRIVVRSELGRGAEEETPAGETLEVVHVNGHVANGPKGMTFSTTQYGARLAKIKDNAYACLVRDFQKLPFVLVGTRLDESPLWQELERAEGTGGGEPRGDRPVSMLVTPKIERARQTFLERLGVAWIPMSTREFTDRILEPIARCLKQARTRA